MGPRVSICVPTFNGAAYLRETIASATAQTVSDWEVLAIDDASTDDTPEILTSFARSDNRIRFDRNRHNLGHVENWNRCLRDARGEWVKFLFQDDLLEPTCLEELLNRADADHSPFVVCYRDIVSAPDIEDEVRNYYVGQRALVAQWLGARTFTPEEFAALIATLPPRNPIGEPTCTLLHRDLIAAIGGFDAMFIHLCDAEYWVRAALRSGVAVVPKSLAKFRVHRGSVTTTNTTSRAYRTGTLDPLMLLYKYLFDPAFDVLRRVANEQSLLDDMEFRFWEACHHARQFALEEAKSGEEQPLSEWRRLAGTHPLIERIPPGQVARRKLRALKRRFWG